MTATKMRPRATADYMRVSVSKLAKLRMSGKGPRYSKVDRVVLYDAIDVDDWLEALKRASTSE